MARLSDVWTTPPGRSLTRCRGPERLVGPLLPRARTALRFEGRARPAPPRASRRLDCRAMVTSPTTTTPRRRLVASRRGGWRRCIRRRSGASSEGPDGALKGWKRRGAGGADHAPGSACEMNHGWSASSSWTNRVERAQQTRGANTGTANIRHYLSPVVPSARSAVPYERASKCRAAVTRHYSATLGFGSARGQEANRGQIAQRLHRFRDD